MGAGHDVAAGALARRLAEGGHQVRLVDMLDVGRSGQGARLRRLYAVLVRRLPWAYDLVMREWARWPAPWERLTAAGAGAYERGLEAEVHAFEPDIVVSVYNLASQALGRLRRSGRLRVPVVTYVSDPGAHPYWISSGVDRHLAVLPQTVQALCRLGAREATLVAPLLPPLRDAALATGSHDRTRARRRLNLPPDPRIVLVSGGSWGCGDVSRTVHLLARSEAVLPVALCGRDEGLLRRLRDRFPDGIDLEVARRALAERFGYQAVARMHHDAWFEEGHARPVSGARR
jgi:UDP-N-acetylglucosamine:LPS N-acetylglucosamine transferase